VRFELPPLGAPVHVGRVPLRWGDMDAMGHVNNTLYFRYFEIVRMDWLAGFGPPDCAPGQGPVIINAFCNFLRQLEFPGELRVTLFVTQPGRSSFESYHTIERSDQPGLVYAEGGARIVWTDFASRTSVPLPDRLRAVMA
jgi:acyl-CoA thioester hydrolase